MTVEVRAPAEQTEGTRSQVLRWLKNVGDEVAENEPLIEIETDKVTVEVASPGSGILREIVKGEQEEITPGEILGRIEPGDPGDARSDGAAGDVGRADAHGSGAAADTGRADAHGAGAAEMPGAGVSSLAVPGAGAVGGGAGFAANRLSPAVRRLLAENALDPGSIRGTGQGGRITVEDVLAAVAAGRGASGVAGAAATGRGGSGAADAAAAGASGATSVRTAAGAQASAAAEPSTTDVSGGSRRIPHTAVRKRIAEHMVQSLLHTAPHVTTVFEADMTAVLAHRQKYRDDFAKRGVPLTLTAYFLQAIVDAIGAVPEANSRWTEAALEVFDSIHVGVATALEGGGLVVPVLRDVQSRDLSTTAQGLNDLVARAREGRLTPADVRGGTFTISNHGVSGSLVATPIIINQPQSAILGVGKLEKRAVVVGEGDQERIVVRPRCYVTLTIDHRVMDGHQANRFLETFVTCLTHWA
jgi:2-oxoglutarate dehydrogenase E2 component (dihydrolipoamide succinyltransferase)